MAFFVLPLARLQPAFDIDLAAFAQVFAGDFAETREAHDRVPLGALLLLARLPVLPRLGRSDPQVRHRRTALCVSRLRIAPQIADQDDFVDAARHVSSRVADGRETRQSSASLSSKHTARAAVSSEQVRLAARECSAYFCWFSRAEGSVDEITLRGARTHNLKNFDLTIPRDQLVVITGLSGSGKSSLAFDTLYAEGQRRYVESLSAYARQFLSMMEKPDIDHIEGLSPAISIEQKSTSHNPRSTVGTITEIYDYLRLLFARVGEPRCPNHGQPLAAQTVSQMVDQVLALPGDARIMVLAPVIVRSQRRTPARVPGTGRQRFHPGAGRRHRHGPRPSADARQEEEAHDRSGHRPAARARRRAAAARRVVRNRHLARRRRGEGVVHRRREGERAWSSPRGSPARIAATASTNSNRACSRSTTRPVRAPSATAWA